jgi:signal transduction histidine kinase
MRLLPQIAVALWVSLSGAAFSIAQPVQRPVLVLDQSIPHTAWISRLFVALQSGLKAGSDTPITVYSEHLEYTHFRGPEYEELLRNFIKEKYRNRNIGTIVAIGVDAAHLAVTLRDDLGKNLPVVYADVDDRVAASLKLIPNTTGVTVRATVRDAIAVAKIVVPNLKQIAVVGDPLEQQTFRRHYNAELLLYGIDLGRIDLTGLAMPELLRRVATLPADAAILYTTLSADGAGNHYDPNDALALIANVANRPIIVDQETRLGYGGVGGFLMHSAPVGEATAAVVLRLLKGENPANIPVTSGEFTKPIFDWRELKRWNVSESKLPPGSEVRFRPASAWQQYETEILTALAVLLVQTAIISALLLERHRRVAAEAASRDRLLENIHLNRVAVVEASSRSIAHELKQPLTAIRSNAQAGRIALSADPPDMDALKEILDDIIADNRRADDVLVHVRQLLAKKRDMETREFDLNDTITNALQLVASEATKRRVALRSRLVVEGAPVVRADPIHLQQVILNLTMNAMEAMDNGASSRRELMVRSALVGKTEVMVTVSDTGPGISEDKLKTIFEPFVTSKEQGTGLGLSIARTILEAYRGKIWAENGPSGGAEFRFVLPLSNGGA